MPSYHLSHRAQQDLINIWNYTEEKWSELQAESYITDIKEGLDELSQFPNLAQQYKTLGGHAYLKYFINSHIVILKIENDILYITRILNQRMNIDEHL